MSFSWKKVYLRTLGRLIPTDFFSHRFPVSIKGICVLDGRIVLVKNEHGAWDLPGGKLKRHEDIRRCLTRELYEELNITAEAGPLIGATRMRVRGSITVLVLIYRCSTDAREQELRLSSEHFAIATFLPSDIPSLNLPAEYSKAIDTALAVQP